ncbi:tetratricopeptide repeat protein [Polaribacter vadi]|uniref:tetratricopeptide repeat protein n=1 Tax=Polaribacter TaxID=52959 RepID=UPI001C0A65FE|nr:MULTISPECIES: tetratricopeptide repeat protein [Polaribacter]MBU3011486.1 tetratricopeptide repeat protein [Polaribacter vadi]MDO6741298.1 tetratricopeptide repeat protein [Polaribacter sp. 1_MG-2023]
MKHLLFTIFLVISCFSFGQKKEDQNNFFLAETYFRQGEYEKATQIYQKLYEKSSFNTTYLNRLITCYQETDKFETAENLLKNKLKENPTQSFLYVFLGYNFEKQHLKEIAKTNYEKAIASLNSNGAYEGIIGRLFKDYNLLDYAILAYEKAMESNENSNYNFQIAQIYGEKGDFKLMFESYINLVDKNENYLNLIQRYASKYITDDAENETNILFRKTLLRKAASKPKDEWNMLLSWLFAQQKDYGKALIQEKALYQRSASDLSEIFSLGKLAFDNKDYEASENCFNFIDKNSFLKEEKIEANLYLAKIAVATKNPNTEKLFQALFKQFGKNQQTIDLQVNYADFLTFHKNQPEKATTILKEALTFSKSKFDKGSIKLKLGDVLVFRGQFNKALIYFSQIQTQLKGSELAQQARFKVAQTSYFKGDFDWAKAQLKVLKSSTTQLIANDAVDLFLKITDNEPVDSIPSGLKQLAKAELLSYQNKNAEALKEIDNLFSSKEILINGLIPGEVIYDDVLLLQAKLLIKQEKYLEAIASLEKIIAADNQGFLTDDVYFLMAETYNEKLNDTEKAQEYYQKIIFDHPSSIYLVDARKKYRKLRGDTI